MSPRAQLTALVTFMAMAGLFMMASPRTMKRLQSFVLEAVAPFAATGSGVQRQMWAFTEGLKNLEQLEAENAQLHERLRLLEAENQLLQGFFEENSRLRQALEYKERSTFRLIAARVEMREPGLWWSTVSINRGKRHGIRENMPVLTEQGLVGRVSNVGEISAKVLLISDETSKISAIVEGTTERGVVSGERVVDTKNPVLRLEYLSKQANLQRGQKVYSSGVGGVFPYGLLIGHVDSFTVRGLDGRAEVLPAADLNLIENVFVVDPDEEQ